MTPPPRPRCPCGAIATNQALFRRDDGAHILGSPRCDEDRGPLGPLAEGVEVVDFITVAWRWQDAR